MKSEARRLRLVVDERAQRGYLGSTASLPKGEGGGGREGGERERERVCVCVRERERERETEAEKEGEKGREPEGGRLTPL